MKKISPEAFLWAAGKALTGEEYLKVIRYLEEEERKDRENHPERYVMQDFADKVAKDAGFLSVEDYKQAIEDELNRLYETNKEGAE